ncbi:MAG: hypothetical protein AAB546_00585 [Patescibacteria group bacterium]
MIKPQNPSNPAENAILKPYKEIEFNEFIKLIGGANIPSWSIFAEVLGVNRETVARWKKHPLAQAAIINAINENLRKMETSGREDWKMYREILRMLGVKDKRSIENYSHDNTKSILDQLEKENLQSDYVNLAEKAAEELSKREVVSMRA